MGFGVGSGREGIRGRRDSLRHSRPLRTRWPDGRGSGRSRGVWGDRASRMPAASSRAHRTRPNEDSHSW